MIQSRYLSSLQRVVGVLCLLISAWSSAIAATPAGQVEKMIGEYTLLNSVNDPVNANWRYKKAWLSVRKLDDQHYLFLIACGWIDSPRAQCDEWFVLERRDNQFFMMDHRSPIMALMFDSKAHKLAMVAEGANGTKRLDIYVPGNFIATRDADLVRRMKAVNKSWEAAKNTKIVRNATFTTGVMNLAN